MDIKEYEIFRESISLPFIDPHTLTVKLGELKEAQRKARARVDRLTCTLEEVEQIRSERTDREMDFAIWEIAEKLEAAVQTAQSLGEKIGRLEETMEDVLWSWGEE